MNKIMILSPLPLEMEALLSRIQEHGHEFAETFAGPLKVFEFPELGWQFSLAGHGKVQFGIQTQFLIGHYRHIDAIICAGCAGGLAKNVSVFDVIAAEKTIEHDYRLRFAQRPDPEFAGDESLLAKIKECRSDKIRIHFGAVASGDEDIVDPGRALELSTQTRALAVAWEGAGGARACKFNNVPFLELRGITDTANNTAPIDFAANLKLAMANVADTLLSAFT
jgi:adenosylhomocysteine nucleosidase